MKYFIFIIFILFILATPICHGVTPPPDCSTLDSACNAAGSEQNWSPDDLIGQLMYRVFGLLGAFSLLIFIYAGVMWMFAQGNATTIKKAQQTMLWAVLGLFVVFNSYILVKYVFGVITF